MTVPAVVFPASGAPAPPPIEVAALPDQPFPASFQRQPELAAALLSLPGGLGERTAMPAGIDPETLARRLVSRLQGLLPESPETPLAVFLAAAERRGVQGVAHGGVALVVVPADGSADLEEIIGVAAEALVASTFSPAAPVEGIGEPLLALAEALGRRGALALASLPEGLRPVSAWLETSTARAALEGFIAQALARDVPWVSRRALLESAGRPRGSTPAVSQAAAALLECLGSPAALVADPPALLEAWSRYEGKACPKMPRLLRRALADPARAGLPSAPPPGELAAVRAAARERLVAAGRLDPLPEGDFSPGEILVLAARARAAGRPGLCEWLRARPLPSRAPTGCRDEEASGGFLLSRPLPGRRFQIDWVAGDGSQHPVVIWPRWVLAPALCGDGAQVCFLDPQGVWRVPLDGRSPPAIVTPGSYRRLAASPGGTCLAAARWPEAEVWIGTEAGGGVRIPVAGHAGMAWVDREVVAVASGTHIGLFSPSGEGRSEVLAGPAITALSARGGRLYAAEATASGPALVRVDLGTGGREHLTAAPAAVWALHAAADGSLVVATELGLWRWRPGETAQRFSDGLSVAP
ncbi:MAG TPA: hypothetical protein PLR87_00790 [Thermoanaerobaculaceae bacterium]|nr:hypothetical protein [Thermoanaerobaculaceae bacterium]